MLFETMQTELEETTEKVSQMVARAYLRTPKAKIIDTAQVGSGCLSVKRWPGPSSILSKRGQAVA